MDVLFLPQQLYTALKQPFSVDHSLFIVSVPEYSPSRCVSDENFDWPRVEFVRDLSMQAGPTPHSQVRDGCVELQS